jgi:hypothetical protein
MSEIVTISDSDIESMRPAVARLVPGRLETDIVAELKDNLRRALEGYVSALNAVKDAGFEPTASISPSAWGGRYVITDVGIGKKL